MKTKLKLKELKQIQRLQVYLKTKSSQTLEVAEGQDHLTHSEEQLAEAAVEAVLQEEDKVDPQLVTWGKGLESINLKVASKDTALIIRVLSINPNLWQDILSKAQLAVQGLLLWSNLPDKVMHLQIDSRNLLKEWMNR